MRSVRTIRVRTARSSRARTRAPERQLAETDGQNAAAGAPYEQAHPAIVTWTQSSAADRGTNELTLDDLKAMQQS
ncbi:hypothetical protein [Streptomyces decoyicus]|uniref:hypothetical protein n=1 Tax=Streptomyces decoyicus TaxID=249567 RepID=UPI003814AD78